MKSKDSRVGITVILVFLSLYYIWFCNIQMVELPHMTWFDQIPLADLFFSGNIKISDLFSRYGEHGMLANNIIYLFNVCFFHGSTLTDVYINDINVIIIGVIFAYFTTKTVEDNKIKYFWIVAEGLFLFGCMQGSAGAMETQVRLGILFFVVAMVLVDKELRENELCIGHLIATIFLIFLSINVFGTLYSFAGVPLIWFIVCFKIIKSKKVIKKDIVVAGTYAVTIPLYIAEYQLVIEKTAGDTVSLFDSIKNLFLGIFSWCANGCFGWAVHESAAYNSTGWLISGFIVFVLVIISVVMFFWTKMYQKTWLPLMCIVYNFGVYVMLSLGRQGAWEWFANEWYNVHIKIMIASSIWIYAYIFSLKKYRKCIIVGVAVLCMAGIVGNYYGIKRAPFVKAYYKEKQKYLFVQDESYMPTDSSGMTPLLHSLDATMNSIMILEKYNLSVYQYWDSYKECEAFYLLESSNIKWINGRFNDGWVEKTSSFKVDTYDGTTSVEIIYYSLKNQNISVKINGEDMDNTIEISEGDGKFVVSVPQNNVVTVELISDYSSRLSDDDLRDCSFIVSDVVCIR